MTWTSICMMLLAAFDPTRKWWIFLGQRWRFPDETRQNWTVTHWISISVEFYILERLHGVCISLQTGVPKYPKCATCIKAFFWSHHVCDISFCSFSSLLEVFFFFSRRLAMFGSSRVRRKKEPYRLVLMISAILIVVWFQSGELSYVWFE